MLHGKKYNLIALLSLICRHYLYLFIWSIFDCLFRLLSALIAAPSFLSPISFCFDVVILTARSKYLRWSICNVNWIKLGAGFVDFHQAPKPCYQEPNLWAQFYFYIFYIWWEIKNKKKELEKFSISRKGFYFDIWKE